MTTLHMKDNACSEHVTVHPVIRAPFLLYSGELASIVAFDKRQLWTVFFAADVRTPCWVVSRGSLYLRMSVKDFEYYFGKYEVIS